MLVFTVGDVITAAALALLVTAGLCAAGWDAIQRRRKRRGQNPGTAQRSSVPVIAWRLLWWCPMVASLVLAFVCIALTYGWDRAVKFWKVAR